MVEKFKVKSIAAGDTITLGRVMSALCVDLARARIREEALPFLVDATGSEYKSFVPGLPGGERASPQGTDLELLWESLVGGLEALATVAAAQDAARRPLGLPALLHEPARGGRAVLPVCEPAACERPSERPPAPVDMQAAVERLFDGLLVAARSHNEICAALGREPIEVRVAPRAGFDKALPRSIAVPLPEEPGELLSLAWATDALRRFGQGISALVVAHNRTVVAGRVFDFSNFDAELAEGRSFVSPVYPAVPVDDDALATTEHYVGEMYEKTWTKLRAAHDLAVEVAHQLGVGDAALVFGRVVPNGSENLVTVDQADAIFAVLRTGLDALVEVVSRVAERAGTDRPLVTPDDFVREKPDEDNKIGAVAVAPGGKLARGEKLREQFWSVDRDVAFLVDVLRQSVEEVGAPREPLSVVVG